MSNQPIKCDVCGRFISYSDIETGRAVYRMLTPDSALSYETWESLCRKHCSDLTPNCADRAEAGE